MSGYSGLTYDEYQNVFGLLVSSDHEYLASEKFVLLCKVNLSCAQAMKAV